MNKKNIIIIAIIILIVFIGYFGFMKNSEVPDAKKNSRIVITSNSTLHVGDNITVKLTDINGNPIKNETINITIYGQDHSTSYNTVVTNKKGVGILSLEKSAGKYTNNATFQGNDEYSGNTTTQKFLIESS